MGSLQSLMQIALERELRVAGAEFTEVVALAIGIDGYAAAGRTECGRAAMVRGRIHRPAAVDHAFCRSEKVISVLLEESEDHLGVVLGSRKGIGTFALQRLNG